MKQSIVLVAGLLAVLATSAEAQKAPLSLQKGAQAHQVKRAAQPRSTVALPPAPLVGGSDSCTTPDAITGVGTFAYDNTLATTGTQGQTETSCNFFATTAIDNDVWFVWTAPTTGVAIFDTCSGSFDDTKLAAYAGVACPTAGTALGCSDDDCNFSLQSRVQFAVTGGNSYVLQLGNYPTATPGTGTFSLTVSVPPANDDCTTPQTVAGVDTRHAFDNTLASTGAQGQAESTCVFFGSPAIPNDLWYTWVAPSTGTFAVVTEGLTGVDTKIAVYNGVGCPGAANIGCNDDGGVADLQTITAFTATSGNSYTIQLGLYAFTTSGGPGEFSVISTTTRPEDSCAAPVSIAGQGLFPFDNVFSTAGPQGQSEALCTSFGSTTIDSDSWYLWTPDASGTATITTCPTTWMDTKIGIYPGPGCPAAGTAIACEDDSCGPTFFQTELMFPVVCGQTYLLQVGSYPYGGQDGGLGDLDISIVGGPCATPSTPFCDGSGVGTACVACGNNGAAGRGCANSSFAAGALLTNTGIASITADTLVLTCTDLTGPGLFFQANGLISPTAFGDGMLCAGISIIRMGVVFPTGNSASYPGGLTPAPIHIAGGPIAAGDLKHYQCWYRDAVSFCTSATFNTSNGVSLTWTN